MKAKCLPKKCIRESYITIKRAHELFTDICYSVPDQKLNFFNVIFLNCVMLPQNATTNQIGPRTTDLSTGRRVPVPPQYRSPKAIYLILTNKIHHNFLKCNIDTYIIAIQPVMLIHLFFFAGRYLSGEVAQVLHEVFRVGERNEFVLRGVASECRSSCCRTGR